MKASSQPDNGMAISPVAMSVVDAVDVTVNRTLLIQQWHETRLEDAVKLEEVQRRFIEAAHVQYPCYPSGRTYWPDSAAGAS